MRHRESEPGEKPATLGQQFLGETYQPDTYRPSSIQSFVTERNRPFRRVVGRNLRRAVEGNVERVENSALIYDLLKTNISGHVGDGFRFPDHPKR